MAEGESKIQTAIMSALMDSGKVAHAHVTTNGRFKKGPHWVSVGFTGQSDIIGQMMDGRYLAIEVKQPGKKPTDDQIKFINMVRDNNGVAGWADSVEGALGIILDD